jgi:hypothetical protein
VVSIVIRGAWGAVLFFAPGLPLQEGGGLDTRVVRRVVRILGARHLIEAVVLARAHDGRPRRWIARIDAVHALSMLGLAAVNPVLRRDATLSAASAGVLVALSAAEH